MVKRCADVAFCEKLEILQNYLARAIKFLLPFTTTQCVSPASQL